jgi:hypothetical protein
MKKMSKPSITRPGEALEVQEQNNMQSCRAVYTVPNHVCTKRGYTYIPLCTLNISEKFQKILINKGCIREKKLEIWEKEVERELSKYIFIPVCIFFFEPFKCTTYSNSLCSLN